MSLLHQTFSKDCYSYRHCVGVMFGVRLLGMRCCSADQKGRMRRQDGPETELIQWKQGF